MSAPSRLRETRVVDPRARWIRFLFQTFFCLAGFLIFSSFVIGLEMVFWTSVETLAR